VCFSMLASWYVEACAASESCVKAGAVMVAAW
jgi:hypothetical protein